MTEREKKFLSDISNSIHLIERFTKDVKMITLKGNLHGAHLFSQGADLEDEIIRWLEKI